MLSVSILRYGHRSKRDYRVTSHCALVARAFGANEIIICGAEDASIRKSVENVTKKWGGKFGIRFCDSWRNELKNFRRLRKSAIVHLTMYGLPVGGQTKRIRKFGKIMVVVGSGKVEGEVYKKSDFNISITQQPHSEIAALAVFLHELFGGKEINKKFPHAKIKIVPQAKGKLVFKLR